LLTTLTGDQGIKDNMESNRGNKGRVSSTTILREGDRIEVSIERILPGGFGLAHFEGATVFVYLAAPGDRLAVLVEKMRGTVTWARIEEILEPSPLRIEPPCPYFGRCGGCDLQQLSYPTQLETKLDIVRDCLRRITKIEIPSSLRIIGSPLEWGYRSRAMWQRDRDNDLLGYYERGSHNVCDVANCAVLTQPMQRSLEKVRTVVQEKRLAQDVREILAVEGDDGVGIVPPLNEGESLETKKTIGQFTYSFSAGGFFQINQLLLPALIDEVIAPLEGRNALDLYCGVGLFSLPLAAKFEKVIGIESNHEAIGYARRNAENAGYENVEFESEMVGRWFERNNHVDRRIDAVLLDPPRVGAEKATMRGIVALKPKKICYVSCDPATLARDLKPLLENGYNIDSISAFDMFPQTHHIETVTHLSIGSVGKNNGERRSS